jgi:hypothetical protein
MIMNDKQARIWRHAATTHSKVLYNQSAAKTEEKNEKIQLA